MNLYNNNQLAKADQPHEKKLNIDDEIIKNILEHEQSTNNISTIKFIKEEDTDESSDNIDIDINELREKAYEDYSRKFELEYEERIL